MKKNALIYLFTLLLLSNPIIAKITEDKFRVGECYTIRLNNGDVVEGELLGTLKDSIEGVGIRVELDFGIAKFFENQIAEIETCSKFYRHSHKYFLLPTAIGIGKNHFLGLKELFLLYGGFGIWDYFSIIAGHSMLPFISGYQQISLLNIKASIPKFEFEDVLRELHIAFGSNLGFANHNNRFIHFYGVATVLFYKTSLSTCLFYKFGSGDYYLIRYGVNEIDVSYPDGAFGLSAGFDTRLPGFKDLRIIGEIWNINITRPTHSGIFFGIRLTNSKIATDFGLSWFTQPFLIPFVNFVWTPF
ncbi:MAG: hypothetical protein N2517_01725 [Ignavibacteria bacterium]|nr:hypothetical protein [Ignavibacteria bacterium]